jgi:hypothetical protein
MKVSSWAVPNVMISFNGLIQRVFYSYHFRFAKKVWQSLSTDRLSFAPLFNPDIAVDG